MSDQLFYLFSAILLGLVIGALIMYFASGSSRDSKKTIDDMEKKLKGYQNEVAEHFEQTADLVDEMTQSYKKGFDHLGKSARLLMTDEQIQEQIEKRKGRKVTLEFLTDDTVGEAVENDGVQELSQSSDVTQNEGVSEDDVGPLDLEAESPEMNEELVITESEQIEDLEQEVEQREKNIYT